MKTSEELKKLQNRVKLLEDFISDLEPSPKASAKIEDLGIWVVRGSDRHKLWTDLRLTKYPGDY